MKTRIIVLALAIASNLALAETEGTSSTSGKLSQLARMENKLGLSDEQVQKMREIRESGGSMEDMRAVLTPEQQSQAAQLRKDHKGEFGAQMQQALGLTEQQVAEIQEIRQDGGSREDIRAVLTSEQQSKLETMRGSRAGKGFFSKES
jgi:Spy/CpxP family protein refolding chaperone